MEIEKIIESAFNLARIAVINGNNDQDRNRQRSIKWVESLADTFREAFNKENNVRVFSKYNTDNQHDFRLNELLFDISVVKINMIESPRHKELTYIEKALWIVESEMAKDTRQLVLDFSKLVMGDAENKLFVGPISEKIEKFIPKLSEIARNCKGLLYLCLILHPEKWNNNYNKPKIWKFDGNEFINLKSFSS